MRPRLDSCYAKAVGKKEWQRSWILLVSLHVPATRGYWRVKAAVIQIAQSVKRRMSLQMAELMTRRRCNVSTSWFYLCAACISHEPVVRFLLYTALFAISETSVLGLFSLLSCRIFRSYVGDKKKKWIGGCRAFFL